MGQKGTEMKFENASVKAWRVPSVAARNRFYLEAAKALRRLPSGLSGPWFPPRKLAADLPTRDAYWFARSLLRQHGLEFEEPVFKKARQAEIDAYREKAFEAALEALAAERWLARRTGGELGEAHATLAAFLWALVWQLRVPEAA